MSRPLAVVIGVGPGAGSAIARRFAGGSAILFRRRPSSTARSGDAVLDVGGQRPVKDRRSRQRRSLFGTGGGSRPAI
jgi:NAD(P)-dependent dehydrogenase (short-subunit alcohol dehydrogenase family)